MRGVNEGVKSRVNGGNRGIGRLIHNRWDVERSGGLGFRFIATR